MLISLVSLKPESCLFRKVACIHRHCTIRCASVPQHSVSEIHPCCGFIIISFLVILSRTALHGLENEMANHSSVLAWRIPGTGEPGGRPSVGPQSQTQLKRFSSSSSSPTRCSRICQPLTCSGSLGQPLMSTFPCGSAGKESACNVGDLGSIPWSGRSPGEGNGNPFQYSCLENPMDRGVGQAAVHGIAELDMTVGLTNFPVSGYCE